MLSPFKKLKTFACSFLCHVNKDSVWIGLNTENNRSLKHNVYPELNRYLNKYIKISLGLHSHFCQAINRVHRKLMLKIVKVQEKQVKSNFT